MNVIEMAGLGFRYAGHQALSDIDLALPVGRLTALLGPNGAGKSTLVKLMLGLLRPASGQIQVLGGDPRRREVRRRIGTMLQISGVPHNLTVRELVDLFASFYPGLPTDQSVRTRALGTAGIEELADRRFEQLSGGQRQRLMLALAVVGQPRLLILDEPGNGLDPVSRRELGRTIRQQLDRGASVILCTHDLEEAARLADQVVILNDGRIRGVGRPGEIAGQVPTRRIRCRTRLNASELAALPGSRRVNLEAGTADILVSDCNAFLRALLAADPDPAELEVGGASLESAFLDLTTGAQERAA